MFPSSDSDKSSIEERRRAALAETLLQGGTVEVLPSGELVSQEESRENGMSCIEVPTGKLAKEVKYGVLLVS